MAHTGTGTVSAGDPKTRLLANQVIGGRYKVSHLLGEGGMASVWAGSNERTGKRVALKVIRPDFLATPGAEGFLQSEGLAASRVNHPNVVTVFDVIEHEGMACIVMELLDGLPLGTYINRSGQLSVREATSILLPAMRGVAAAHAQGVIHRDLKPQNIFVCIDPDGRVVTTKVLDFGISLMMDWARVRAITTMPGLVGTPAYMAPEHIEDSEHIDERVDVYGFGLLLYESLTARMPFPGDDQTEVLRRVLNDAPAPLRELRPDLPPSLVGIVEKAMAKQAIRRFNSLNQMISEIEDLMMSSALPQGGTPVAGVPTALSYTVSGPLALAVPTHVAREASGLHQETVMFGQSPKPALDEAAPTRELIEERSRKVVELAKSSPAGVGVPMAAPSPPADFPSTQVSPRGFNAVLVRLRDRRVLVGAGVAMVIIIVTLIASSGNSGARVRAKTTTTQTSTQLGLPVGAAPATAPAPPVVTPIASEPAPVTTVEEEPAPESADLGEHHPGAASPQIRSNRSENPAPRGSSPRERRRSAPRAGTLRIDDF
jgi:serine/threonine protein kinase